MNRYLMSLLAGAIVLAAPAKAEDPRSLHHEILRMDRVLFDAFNSCDLTVMGRVFSEDLEFFHDTGGLSGYEDTMRVTLENCEKNLGLVRTLDLESMTVYPIKDYGAIQEAEHTFCHVEGGKDDCGTFKFVHVWRERDGEWKLTRVISYGHLEAH